MRRAWLLIVAGCTASPAPDTSPERVPPPPAVSTPTASEPTAAAPAPLPPEPAEPAPLPPEPAEAAPEEPPLVDAEGELLPQTEERPSSESPLFQHHARLLLRALVENEPEVARPFFFPKVAYEKVKAIAKPGADWEARLWKLFARDIHDYHQQLEGKRVELVGIEVPEAKVEWMKPHREGNAIGYHRVKRAQLVLMIDGAEKRFEITSMISWRGQWYVVHLHGFE